MSDILGCNSMGLKLSIRGEVITERCNATKDFFLRGVGG